MKNILLTAFILGCFLVSEKVHAETKITTFLKIGIYSPEVKILQQILNKDTSTKVATFGPGSPGSETNYFGAMTKKAVMAFQAKNGLIADGLVGAKTREKLNMFATVSLTSSSQIFYPYGQNPNLVYPSTTTTQNTTTVSSGSNILSLSQTPISISSIYPNNALPGDTVDIRGSGFSDKMLAFIDIDKAVDFELIDSGHIKIVVPDNETQGSKWFYLANAHTDTRWTQPAFILVTNSPVNNSSNQFWEALKVIERQNNKFLAMSDQKSDYWHDTKERIVKIFKEIIPIKPKTAHAQTNNFFGGRIISVMYCACPANPGQIIRINNLVQGGPTSLGYSPIYSTLHSNFNISVANVQVVGGTTPSTFSCLEPAYPQGCQEIDSAEATIDLLRGVGTSAS